MSNNSSSSFDVLEVPALLYTRIILSLSKFCRHLGSFCSVMASNTSSLVTVSKVPVEVCL